MKLESHNLFKVNYNTFLIIKIYNIKLLKANYKLKFKDYNQHTSGHTQFKSHI